MNSIINLITGCFILFSAIFLGNFLAKWTKEELKSGQLWFKIIITLSLTGMIIGLILGNDFLLFSFAFIALITSRSLKFK